MVRVLSSLLVFAMLLPVHAHAAATYTWNVSGIGSWTTPTNWTPTRTTPALDDVLIFDGLTTTVSDVPNQNIAQLLVIGGARVTLTATGAVNVTINDGTAGDDLVVGTASLLALNATPGSGNSVRLLLPAGATGNVGGEFTAANGAHRLNPTDPGAVLFQGGSFCRTLSGFFGALFGDVGASNVVTFAAGSTYEHGGGITPFGLTQPASRVVFQTGSLARILANPGGGGFGGRIYGDLFYNTPTIIVGGSSIPITADNVTVLSGGFRSVGPSGQTWHIKGNLTVDGFGIFENAPTTTAGTVLFNGAAPQTIAGSGSILLGSLTVLDIANPSGLSLGRYLLSDGTVSLSGGNITTGPYMLHLGENATVSGPKWVVGNVGRIIPASVGTLSRTFPIGDATVAAPIEMSFASVSDSGTIVARTDPGDHANIASSGLKPDMSANRVWSVQELGVGFSSYDITLGFAPTDLDPGANPATFAVAKRTAGAWTLPTVGARTATSTQALALTTLSEFQVGEPSPVGVETDASTVTMLGPALPTPFRLATTLEYRLERADVIDLSIYGVDGRRLRTLHRGSVEAGVHRTGWNGRDEEGRAASPGIYFVRLTTGAGVFRARTVKIE